ncbi:hypothetical protein [Moorena sp. SIO3H5]|uniref:hypothetical protein n=1 Tax=Moorena sp. SIO3H5 TaxID=2607834 RepID=UPI0013BA64C7|nr:hypothetical protein [Moorena sp. SIO3H5]NEO68230.1 hypothetical protein [Moorena sp. SIO3H5]
MYLSDNQILLLFYIPYSLFPIPYSLLPVPCSLFPVPYLYRYLSLTFTKPCA